MKNYMILLWRFLYQNHLNSKAQGVVEYAFLLVFLAGIISVTLYDAYYKTSVGIHLMLSIQEAINKVIVALKNY